MKPEKPKMLRCFECSAPIHDKKLSISRCKACHEKMLKNVTRGTKEGDK